MSIWANAFWGSDRIPVRYLRPYSKSKLELNSKKSNLSDTKNFSPVFIYLSFLHFKLNSKLSSLSFVRLGCDRTMYTLHFTAKILLNLDSKLSWLLEYGHCETHYNFTQCNDRKAVH